MADSLPGYWSFDVLLYWRSRSNGLKQSCKERAAELRRLDAVLTQIKAELPQITAPELAEAVSVVRKHPNH